MGLLQNLDQWTMRQSLLELQLMIKQTANNVSVALGAGLQGLRAGWLSVAAAGTVGRDEESRGGKREPQSRAGLAAERCVCPPPPSKR